MVVEVGDPLPGPAAELAEVVARGGGTHQGEVYKTPALGEGPGCPHGNMVDPCDVLQRPVGGHLLPQAHQLVEILRLPAIQKAAVILGEVAAGELLFRAEGEIQPRIKGQAALLPQQDLQHLQEAQAAPQDGQRLRFRSLREEDAHSTLVGPAEPALLRLRG